MKHFTEQGPLSNDDEDDCTANLDVTELGVAVPKVP